METNRDQHSTITAEPEQEQKWVAEPQEQHRWLQKLVGEWTWEAEGRMGADAEPFRMSGTESVRALGDLWTIAEGRSEMEGQQHISVMTLGYDPDRARFVGTFLGSTMTHLWVYDGELDAARKSLVLHTEGPNWTEQGGTARYREVIELVSDDERTFTSYMLGADGSERQVMLSHYRRKR
jgi:hypothetical protein